MATDKAISLPQRVHNISGRIFGTWTVIKYVSGGDWLCKCGCGYIAKVRGHRLRVGDSKRCQTCARRMNAAKIKKICSSFPLEYSCWISIRKRCLTKTNKDYQRYGGRGVTICERWIDSFENFLADMGQRPSANHSVDRFPDRNGNYEPNNCRWATSLEQNRNRRNNRLITHNGQTKCIAEWAVELGIAEVTLGYRVYAGWSDFDAITIPIDPRRRPKK